VNNTQSSMKQPPPMTTPRLRNWFSNSNIFKKGTVLKHRRYLIRPPLLDHRFSSQRESQSPHNAFNKVATRSPHCQIQPIKVRPWVFTLEIRLRTQRAPPRTKSSCAVAPTCRAHYCKTLTPGTHVLCTQFWHGHRHASKTVSHNMLCRIASSSSHPLWTHPETTACIDGP
jgi:hypothetical protein